MVGTLAMQIIGPVAMFPVAWGLLLENFRPGIITMVDWETIIALVQVVEMQQVQFTLLRAVDPVIVCRFIPTTRILLLHTKMITICQ